MPFLKDLFCLQGVEVKKGEALEGYRNNLGICNGGLDRAMTTGRMRSSQIPDVFEGEANRIC